MATNSTLQERFAAAPLAHDIKNGVANLRETASDIADAVGAEAKARATVIGRQARRTAETTYKTAHEAVRARPGVAIGVAAGVGLVVGLLLSRRG
ncbi:MAG: hypothetical protein NW203_01715 [Hyphomonadaceae bacterium]|nr:hypothetical protein [Hyphomonadaceae bacterium]